MADEGINPALEQQGPVTQNLSLLNDLNVSVKICIDLDGTICPASDENDFFTVEPFVGAKEVIKVLKDSGHRIIIWTARNPTWRALTEIWLADKGIPYDELVMGKPSANVYIDNKGYRFTKWSDIIEKFLISSEQGGVI